MPSPPEDTTPAETRPRSPRKNRVRFTPPGVAAEPRAFEQPKTTSADPGVHDIIAPAAEGPHEEFKADSRTGGDGSGGSSGTQAEEGRAHSMFGRAPPPKRTRLPLVIGGIVVVILIALLAGWGLKMLAAGGGAGGPRRPQVTVGTATATTGDIPIVIEALGSVTPVANVIVRTRIEGTLDRVEFREGQMVRAGQLLAEVDPRPYVVALQQAQGQLARDEALLANAKLDLQRYKTLVAQDSIARQQYDTQAALVKQDEGTVLADEAAVNSAKLNLTYTKITAPVSGRVGLRHVDPGNIVQTGDANGVVTVTQVSPIDVTFTLPEDDLPAVTHRLGAGASLPVTVFDRADTTQLAQGQLIAVDNLIDPTTGTVKVKARFANADGSLFGSQFVNARLLVDTQHNAVIVPTAAVRHGAPGDFVYVVTGAVNKHVANMRAVKTGPATGDSVSITSGLNAGEVVVTAGGDRLTDKASVMLPGDRPRTGAGGGRGAHGAAAGGVRSGRRSGGNSGGGGGGGDGG